MLWLCPSSVFRRMLSGQRSRCKTPRERTSFIDFKMTRYNSSWSPILEVDPMPWVAYAELPLHHGGSKTSPYWLLHRKQRLQIPELAGGHILHQLHAGAPAINKRPCLFQQQYNNMQHRRPWMVLLIAPQPPIGIQLWLILSSSLLLHEATSCIKRNERDQEFPCSLLLVLGCVEFSSLPWECLHQDLWRMRSCQHHSGIVETRPHWQVTMDWDYARSRTPNGASWLWPGACSTDTCVVSRWGEGPCKVVETRIDKCGSMESCLAVSLLANESVPLLSSRGVWQSEMKLREIH